MHSNYQCIEIPINSIDMPQESLREAYTEDNTFAQLCRSIEANGLLTPISVCKSVNEGRYVLVSGRNRLEAMRKAEKDDIQAFLIEGKDAIALLQIAIDENECRKDFSPIQRAEAYNALFGEKKKLDDAYTHKKMADDLKISQSRLSEILKLTTLPDKVRERLRNDYRFSANQLKQLFEKKKEDGNFDEEKMLECIDPLPEKMPSPQVGEETSNDTKVGEEQSTSNDTKTKSTRQTKESAFKDEKTRVRKLGAFKNLLSQYENNTDTEIMDKDLESLKTIQAKLKIIIEKHTSNADETIEQVNSQEQALEEQAS